MSKLDMKNLIQVSTGGSNINWKMLEILSEERKKNPYYLTRCFLDPMVSIFYMVFMRRPMIQQNGIVRRCSWILKKAPARRADYMKVDDLDETHDDSLHDESLMT